MSRVDETAPGVGGRRPAPGGEVQQRLAYDRTLLASERTFAAWLRTGLSVAAGGIAVAHLVPEPSRDSTLALALGACFVLLGVGVMAHGARQFVALSARLAGESGEAPTLAPRVAYLLTLGVGALLLAVLLFLWSHQGRARPATPPPSIGHSGVQRGVEQRMLVAERAA